MNTPLKHCAFCGSKAERTGGTIGNITIDTCRCSNSDCIAAFKSVDHAVWNTRPSEKDANKTTTRQWVDCGYSSGFAEVLD